ncbi:MAG: glutathione binding-like protein, partial [Halothiobacillus sp.]
YGLLPEFERGEKTVARARKTLREGLLAFAPAFSHKPFFMSDEYSLTDVTLSALLWRLPVYGVELTGAGAKPVLDYMKRMFDRPTFQMSLTEVEREMRDKY